MKAYVVSLNDLDLNYPVAVFLKKELAEKWIDQRMKWKKDFKKKFGIDFDESFFGYSKKVDNWLVENQIEVYKDYYISEYEIIESL